MITPGKLTLDLLFNFENSAYSYFSFKEVKPKKEVTKVAGGLQDGHIVLLRNCFLSSDRIFPVFSLWPQSSMDVSCKF